MRHKICLNDNKIKKKVNNQSKRLKIQSIFMKKTSTLEQKYFFKKFFLQICVELSLTKLTRKNFFSTYRVVFRSKIMVKKSTKWSKMTFRRFFLHICNLHQKLHKPRKFQKNRMSITKTRVYRWEHLIYFLLNKICIVI